MVEAANETNRLTRIALALGYVGFFVAAVGGLIGLVGTALLILTLRESKRAADAAHEANRPWIEPQVKIVEKMRISANGADLTIAVKFPNKGNSPATGVLMYATITPEMASPTLTPRRSIRAVEWELDDMDKKAPATGFTIFPGEPLEQPFDPPNFKAHTSRQEIAAARGSTNKRLSLYLGVGVRYWFGNRKCRTVRSYVIQFPEPGRDYTADDTVHDVHVRLLDSFSGYAV